jgi:hypothetical protein
LTYECAGLEIIYYKEQTNINLVKIIAEKYNHCVTIMTSYGPLIQERHLQVNIGRQHVALKIYIRSIKTVNINIYFFGVDFSQ